MTQRGRIEAARKGVRLNTDAIDNSAGVNTSDVEVNIKIALAEPVRDGAARARTSATRCSPTMTDEVGLLVLRNNYLQTLALSLTEAQGTAAIPAPAPADADAGSGRAGSTARSNICRATPFWPSARSAARR